MFALLPLDAAYRDADPLTHAAIGRAIVQQGGIPTEDPFVSGAPAFRDHEWLSDVLWYAVVSAGGPGALEALTLALFVATLAITATLARRAGTGLPAMVAVSLAAVLALIHLSARPHLFTWLLLMVARGMSMQPFRGLRSLGAWVLLGAIWANLHGGFLPAAAMIALAVTYHGAERGEHLVQALARGATCAIAILLGACANPLGPLLHLHVVGFLLERDIALRTLDMLPALPGAPAFGPFLFLAGAVFLALVATGKSFRLRHLAWAVFALTLAMASGRNIPLVALWLAPDIARWLEAGLSGRSGFAAPRHTFAGVGRRLDGLGRLPGLAVAAILFLGLAGLSAHRATAGGRHVPLEGLQALCDRMGPDDVAFLEFHWGGYLAWTCPAAQVYLHPLTANFHGAGDRMATYGRIVALEPGWDDLLLSTGATYVLIPPEALLTAGLTDQGWSLLHTDPRAVLLLAPTIAEATR